MTVDLSCRNFKDVKSEDMKYFKRLDFINVSENELNLGMFSCFPNLHEIILSYNRMKSLGDIKGKLSYNVQVYLFYFRN